MENSGLSGWVVHAAKEVFGIPLVDVTIIQAGTHTLNNLMGACDRNHGSFAHI